MNTTDTAIRRAQVYRFLADVFLYPTENWLDDLPLLADILRDLNFGIWNLEFESLNLPALQAEHRRAFGLTGSLCYETEFGLPDEYRQSQELADIAGFYRAFGFNMGGKVRERPDHIAAELEFMHVLALKEAWAREQGIVEQAEVCADAQRKFLQDHLGRWIAPFADALARSAENGPYVAPARLAADFIRADAARLGITLEHRPLAGIRPTPFPAEFSCEACPVVSDEQ